MRRILVCTGGSPFGEWAVQLAGQLAKGLEAHLTVLTVQDPKDPVEVQKIQERSRQILEGFAVSFDGKVRKGHPAQEILSESLQGYDMVILGSHGTRGILEFFLGDTAVHVVEHLRTSTLVVRQMGEVSKILLSLRLGKEKWEIVRMAGEIARATLGSLTILYVVPMPVTYGIPVKEHRDIFDRHPLETNYLRKVAVGLEQEYGIRSVLKMREGVPEEEILGEVVEEGHDLVIVGSSTWGGLSSLLLGNFSYTIVKHAKTSVLVAVPKKSS